MFRLVTEAEGVGVIVAAGQLPSEEFLSAYRGFVDAPVPATRVLWDLTAATLTPIPSAEIREMASLLATLGKERGRTGRTAVACRPGVDFGLARMLVMNISAQRPDVEFAVFGALDEARAWLSKASRGSCSS